MTASLTPEEREVAEQAKIVDQAGRLFGLVMPKKYESDTWLYSQLTTWIRSWVDLEDERWNEVLASCALHSYRVRENRTTPYLFANGPTGTGKNRILHVMAVLCEKGFITGDSSAASLYRIMHVHHPTLCVDEAERLAPYRKNQSENVQALLAILNTGYCQDQWVLRADRDSNTLSTFDPYGFKVIASTETLPDTLLGRCIIINTEENVRKDIPVEHPSRDDAKDLRRYLTWYGTVHDPTTPFYVGPNSGLTFDDLKELIPNYRVVEIFGPIYRDTPDPKAQAHILELALEASEDRREEKGSGEDSLILEALLKCRELDMEEGIVTDRIPVASIAKMFNAGRETWETLSSDQIGRKLRKFGLKPCRGHGGVRGIRWNEKKLDRRFKRYGISRSVQSVKVSPDIGSIPSHGDTRTLDDVPQTCIPEP